MLDSWRHARLISGRPSPMPPSRHLHPPICDTLEEIPTGLQHTPSSTTTWACCLALLGKLPPRSKSKIVKTMREPFRPPRQERDRQRVDYQQRAAHCFLQRLLGQDVEDGGVRDLLRVVRRGLRDLGRFHCTPGRPNAIVVGNWRLSVSSLVQYFRYRPCTPEAR